MHFVTRESGSEVALTRGLSKGLFSMIPPDVYFSGAALVKVTGIQERFILVTTQSHVTIYGFNSVVVWKQALKGLGVESQGSDIYRLTAVLESLEIRALASRRKDFLAHIKEAEKNAADADLSTEDSVQIEARPNHEFVGAGIGPKRDNKEIRAEEKAERQRVKRALELSNRDSYGELIIESVCAGKTVRMYSKGYVRISGFFGSNVPYEKLLGISASADIAKKTAIGRGVVAVVTLGSNLLYTSNKRGDLYLTISTDRDTHMLHMSPPTERDLKSMHKLATAGQALLDKIGALHVTTEVKAQPAKTKQTSVSIADEIAKLVALKDAGNISDTEFQAAKKKLL